MVIPLLIGLLGIRFAVSIPWPEVNLPSIPWPDWNLPSIPWPHFDLLPDWTAPAWVTWVADHLRYVWPAVVAGVLARSEIERQRKQEALEAQLKANAASEDL